jgi:branched-chain amino acid transport system permease protein
MKVDVFNGGRGSLRKDDHQFFQPMYIVSLGERGQKGALTRETDWGWRTGQARGQGHDPANDLQKTRQLSARRGTAGCAIRRRHREPGSRGMAELLFISTLNGVLYGLLLFLMASGLTLIFSMMGVLNFAHASFYMLGAFFGFQVSRWAGFWPALILAPVFVGLAGAMVERFGLRNVHRHGHVAELLFTFGLAFVIEELVQIIWGKSPVDFRIPALLDFPAFTVLATNYPAYKLFMLVISIAIFLGLFTMLTRTRIGLIVQGTHASAHGRHLGTAWCHPSSVSAALAASRGDCRPVRCAGEAGGAARPILFVVVVVGGLILAGGVVRLPADRAVADVRHFGQCRSTFRGLVSARNRHLARRPGAVMAAQIAPACLPPAHSRPGLRRPACSGTGTRARHQRAFLLRRRWRAARLAPGLWIAWTVAAFCCRSCSTPARR